MPSVEVLDQASGLRRLLGRQAPFHACAVFGTEPSLKAMALASLAYALARRGESVAVLDEMESPHNVATQYGLAPRHRLADVLQGRSMLDRAVVDAPADVRLLLTGPLSSVLNAMSDVAWDRRLDDLIHAIGNQGWLMVNAQMSAKPSALAASCGHHLLVLPDQRSAITEAYALLKTAHKLRPDGRWHVLVMDEREPGSSEAVFTNLANTAQRFLGVHLEWFGAVPRDEKLAQSVRLMRPLLEVAPDCAGSLAFKALAERAGAWTGGHAMGAREFWQRTYLLGRIVSGAASLKSRDAELDWQYG
ncbi:MAG: hypothetical protein HY850_09655 [Betaproteobacteria bacterium]|nr:hypothetical protein [Betaproteobacteria bacterium]